MTELDLSSVAWRKSTRSGGGEGTCVEVAAAWRKGSRSHEGTTADCVEVLAVRPAGRMVAMRDSKNPEGAVLCFSDPEWTAFLSRIKTGALDLTVNQV
jgi:hypothetical protein